MNNIIICYVTNNNIVHSADLMLASDDVNDHMTDTWTRDSNS